MSLRHGCIRGTVATEVEASWNVIAHGDARDGKWRGNWRMEWVASTLHTTSEHGISSITTADAHTSAASSRLNWRSRRFKRARPFRRKTKSSFCAGTITFQLASTTRLLHCLPFTVPTMSLSYSLPILVFNSFHKETIMRGHDRHNTTILSVIYNMSTTCFG